MKKYLEHLLRMLTTTAQDPEFKYTTSHYLANWNLECFSGLLCSFLRFPSTIQICTRSPGPPYTVALKKLLQQKDHNRPASFTSPLAPFLPSALSFIFFHRPSLFRNLRLPATSSLVPANHRRSQLFFYIVHSRHFARHLRNAIDFR